MLVVDCLFFMFLEWWLPEETLDKVQLHWCRKSFEEVRLVRRFDCGVFDISLPSVTDDRRLGIRWHGVRPPLRCIFSLSPRRYAVRYRLLPAPKVICTYEVCISVPDIAVAATARSSRRASRTRPHSTGRSLMHDAGQCALAVSRSEHAVRVHCTTRRQRRAR